MAFNMNQFKFIDRPGVVQNPNPCTITAMVDAAQGTATPIVAGQAVSLGSGSGKMTSVILAASSKGIGVMLFNPKRDKYYAGYMCEIALSDSIVKMSCNSASVVRGNFVTFISTAGTANAVTQCGGSGSSSNGSIGIALDNCANVGDLINVLIQPIGV